MVTLPILSSTKGRKMANNRMILVCNKCFPEDKWKYGDDVCYIGKWYPIGSYATLGNDVLGEKVNDYFDRHAHTEDVEAEKPGALAHNENPIRLTYEHWVEGRNE